MAYRITSQRGEVEAYVMELVCDTEADVEKKWMELLGTEECKF